MRPRKEGSIGEIRKKKRKKSDYVALVIHQKKGGRQVLCDEASG